MTSTAAPTPVPFREFFFPGNDKSGAAIGRSHASWFLVVPRPEGIPMIRLARCLNIIIPGDPSSVGALSAAGRHLFAVGGTFGEKAMNDLTRMRDSEGRAPIKVVEEYSEDHPFGLCALVEVQVPDEELMYACARCGRWETQLGPRFLRCSGCKSRWYCSAKCQKDDWKPAYHRGECDLLKEGKHYEVETRRKLHDNGWWFHSGGLGNRALMEPTGEYEWERARTEGDWDWVAYGRRNPPHDVPASARARPTFSKEFVASLPPGVPPPGFVTTGNAKDDKSLIERFRATVLGTDQLLPPFLNPMRTPGLESNVVLERDIPPMPELPVPQAPGFVFIGDPPLDEQRLDAFLAEHGTEAEQEAFLRAAAARAKCVEARSKLSEEKERRSKAYRALVTEHLTAVRHNVRVMWGPAGSNDDSEDDDDEDDDDEDDDLEQALGVEKAMAGMSVEDEQTGDSEDEICHCGNENSSEEESSEEEEGPVESSPKIGA
ncbi:hypothetical protein OH76DRAFT_1405531 [Lentinus brumalis]|uniref:MYND-type domain-containing protein n=1 Tax=Lentinus brumalis TaxID=2498619 RepID=A0A371D5C6_9APHY|nr:hypothetical protein OH76DRAFT_1405531 [Polyporus brumalis]